jgi:hypothetical protein
MVINAERYRIDRFMHCNARGYVATERSWTQTVAQFTFTCGFVGVLNTAGGKKTGGQQRFVLYRVDSSIRRGWCWCVWSC